MRPAVWLVAGLVLPVRAGLRGGERVLDGYLRATDAASRAVLRWATAVGRAVLQVLGRPGGCCAGCSLRCCACWPAVSHAG